MADIRAGMAWWSAEDRVERLKQMCASGMSFGVIAERLGVSKNTVIGKAGRLGLLKEEVQPPAPEPTLSFEGCRWPHGDPRHPDFRFCGADAVHGKPYCSEHVAIAYVKAA